MDFSLQFVIKLFIIFITMFLSISGALLMVLGVMLLIFFMYEPKLDEVNIIFIPILIIIFGIILIATNVCGSIDKRICRISYMVVMSILATITLLLGILVLVSSNYYKAIVFDILNALFEDEEFRYYFSEIERNYECCGLTGPDSYLGVLPTSCCPEYPPLLPGWDAVCTPANTYQIGCVDAVSRVFEDASYKAGLICIGFTLLGFLGSGLSLFLLFLQKRR